MAATDIIDYTHAYLVSDEGPDLLSHLKTVQKYLPTSGLRTVDMPMLCVHIVGIDDKRLCMTGAGGVRQESYQLILDLICLVNNPTAQMNQEQCLALVQLIQSKLRHDPFLNETVLDASANMVGHWWIDPLEVTLKGLSHLAWRWESTVIQAPLAS